MTAYLVIDASVSAQIILPTSVHAQAAQKVAAGIAAGYTLCAPLLWRYEITSAITKAHHFAQITVQEAQEALRLAQNARIEFFAPTVPEMTQAWNWAQKLGRAASYDCFYLTLAERLGCELWTADKRLANAANVEWVKLV